MPVAFVKQLPEDHQGPIVRLGTGGMGGKAQGLGFLSSQLQLFDIASEFSPHRILVPDTTVLASDEFDRFVHDNRLDELAGQDDQTIRQRFLDAPLASDVEATLRRFVLQHRCPLAVRSSSLSEDALDHPFAGVYLTYMLANNAEHVDVRTNQLAQAVRLVWAHVFCREPISYMRAHGIDATEEKMAVVLQEVVGNEQGGVFYPLCSGVAQSYNFFPVGRQAAEDGVAAIVLGLGKRAVDDEDALRFSPSHPTVRPDAARPQDLLHTTQKGFYAVDLSSGERQLTGSDLDTLKELTVAEAEGHGTLKNLASTWVAEDRTLYEGTARRGRRVLTFNRLLRGELFPLPAVLGRLLHVVADGFGRPVELEFALTLDKTPEGPRGTFHLLQARPMGSLSEETLDELPTVADERVLLTSGHAMGHRHLGQIRDILFVEPQGFNRNVAYEAARDIARLNDQLVQAGRPYVLIVPGRLGTRNAALGVPVTYAQVAGAAALVELSTCDFATEPSQGTHFFHNMVSRGVPFVSVDTNDGDGFHQDWLERQPSSRHGAVLHVTPNPPLALRVVGTTQQAIAYQQESDDE